MTFSLNRVSSARIKKAKGSKSSSSSLASPSSGHAKRATNTSHLPDIFDEELEDHGLITALATDQRLRDVPQYVRYIREKMFDSIPDRAGMSSTRVAEVLNSQKNMPRICTRAHLHALSKSPTATEREAAEMLRAGVLRRLDIPGRGRGGQAVGDCLVLTDDWVLLVQQSSDLSPELKGESSWSSTVYCSLLSHHVDKYIDQLHKSKGAITVEAQTFTQAEATALTHTGFLTNPSAMNASVILRPDSATLGSLASLASVASRTASGSTAAVGGTGAIHEVGGSGSSLGNASNRASATFSATMTFTIPSIGVFLRLLTAAREHLVHLLMRSRYRHAPLSLLRQRWDGAIDPAEKQTTTNRTGTVLPSKTQKWKRFNGMRFQWVLEECLGAGLVEVFETGSVGLGVRLVS